MPEDVVCKCNIGQIWISLRFSKSFVSNFDDIRDMGMAIPFSLFLERAYDWG